MSTQVRIDGHGIAPMRRKIHDMRARADNLVAAWQVLLDWFADQERLQFGTRGARWHTLWPELAPDTVIQKRREGYMGDILVANTRLMRSLSNRPLPVERLTAHEVVAGTSVKYAIYHQMGTRHMPRRALIDAEQIARENAASSAVISWIVTGRPSVTARDVQR